jgi:hypothetical protein
VSPFRRLPESLESPGKSTEVQKKPGAEIGAI